MDELGGFVEFYITCNPPLLPKGVKYVIDTANFALPEGEIIEILYEPEIPWLKCITTAKSRHEVTELIQSLLLIMLEEETDAVDIRVANPDESDDETTPPDVVIVAEDPRVIPWSTYQDLGDDMYDSFEEYRFPETMLSLAFKAVWRKLAYGNGLTLENLLAGFRFVAKDENAPATIKEFEDLMKCQISYNMRENLIYIGTDEPLEFVERAINRLDAIFEFMVTEPRSVAHLILTESPDPLNIAFRCLSNLGLDRITYVQASDSSLTDEYRFLKKAATIRTEVQDRHERWMLDNTTYPLEDGPETDLLKDFSAFKGRIFRSKAALPNFKAQPLITPQRVVTQQQDPVISAPMAVVPEAVSHKLAEGENYGASHATLEREEVTLPSPSVEGQEAAPQDRCEPERRSPPDRKIGAGDNASKREKDIAQKDLGSDAQSTNGSAIHTAPQTVSLEAMITTQSFISDWRDGVQNATKEVQEQNNLSKGPEVLISFDQSDDEDLGNDANLSYTNSNIISRSEQLKMADMSQFEKSNDLIWLGNESHSEPISSLPDAAITSNHPQNTHTFITSRLRESLGGERNLISATVLEELSSLTVNDNPLETQDHASDPDAVVHFGLLDEQPKEFFRTMNQQGSRDRSRRVFNTYSPLNQGSPAIKGKWATPASQKAGQDQNKGGSSGPKTPSVAPANTNETKESSNIPLDSAWPKLGEVPESPTKQIKKPLLYSDAAKLNNANVSEHGRVQQAPPEFPDLRSNANHFLLESESERRALAYKGAASLNAGGSNGQVKSLIFEGPYNGLTEKSDMLRKTETQLKDMTSILQMIPGNISLEVKFGRIYIKQIAQNIVNNGSGPSFTVKEALEVLNNPDFRQNHVGFSSILTTAGDDVDRLVQINPPDEARWRLSEKETWYDFVCNFGDGQGRRFVVEVDAETFQYRCRGLREEIFAVYAHCPHRAWDIKACATRSSPLQEVPKYRAFSETLIALTSISSNGTGPAMIEIPEEGRLEASVACINIRQVARYRQKKQGGSELTIAMTWAMQENTSAKKASRDKKSKIWSRLRANPGSAIPHQWFEVSVSSSRAREILEQNTNLGFGERASWSVDQLETAGVFEDMCRPAFAMITHMDHIGSMNNNGQGLEVHDAFHERISELDMRKRKQEFW